MTPVVILGCGYTGRRVAALLAAKSVPVIATTRRPSALRIAGVRTAEFDASFDRDLSFIPEGALILYSIPTVDPAVIRTLAARPARVVYLSTTGVYGNTTDVDHTTLPAPALPQQIERMDAEKAIAEGPWSTMVLRPAAIYGPGRGVCVSMKEGRYRLAGDGSNYVSRIHVDDLALHCEAALFSEMEGAWPVADEHPTTSREIAEYCSKLLGIPMPATAEPQDLHHTRQANRRVNGSEVRKLLGISLRYPGYVEGVRASTEVYSG